MESVHTGVQRIKDTVQAQECTVSIGREPEFMLELSPGFSKAEHADTLMITSLYMTPIHPPKTGG